MGEVAVAVSVHPAAQIFPDMSDEMFQELVEDIAENGLLEAVVMHDGMILDGRHRWRACERADCVVQTVEWDGECGSPEAFVVSRNLRRRHLTSSQRAMLAVQLLPELEKEARERQGARSDLTETIPEGSEAEAREKAAELAGTNPRYVSDAKRIKEEAPDLAEKVKTGEVTIPAAKKELQDVTTAEAATNRHVAANIRHGMVPEGWKDTQRNRALFRKAFNRADVFFLVTVGAVRFVSDEIKLAKALSVASTEEVDGWIQECRDAVPALNRVKKKLLQHQEARAAAEGGPVALGEED